MTTTTVPDTTDNPVPLPAVTVYLRLVDLMLTAGLLAPRSINRYDDSTVFIQLPERCDRAAVDQWATALGLSGAREGHRQKRSALVDYTTPSPSTPVDLMPGWAVLVYAYVEEDGAAEPVPLDDDDHARLDRIRTAAEVA